MYIIIREGAEGENDTVCLVQAKDNEAAKKMVGVPPNCATWLHINDDLVSGLADVKEGYIARQI